MSATEAKVLAHYQVLLWAHVLEWQVDRLRESRPIAIEAFDQVRARGIHEPSDNWRFYEMDAEKHFVMVAARNLLRALRAFDDDVRLPSDLSNKNVKLLRDALEHWDEPTGDAQTQMAKIGADSSSHEWLKANFAGRLGKLILDETLRQWATDVYAELVLWDE